MTTAFVTVLVILVLLIGIFAGWMMKKENKQVKEQAENNLKSAFGALAAEALRHNNEAFITLAETKLDQKTTEANGLLESRKQAIDELVKPLGDSLKDMKSKINELEVKREGAYGEVKTWIEQMKATTADLDKGTRSLVGALKNSSSRGRYGEIALRRLVEFSGMLEHCDFEEQVSTASDNGRLRPDMIIHLPEKRKVVVDSKVPLSAYLEIFETEDQEQQKQLIEKHINAIKIHLKQLSSKNYWDQFEEAPDFVILYMQIESSFGAALQAWPGMIEEALSNRIIIATPTTFISILRSIGYSWNQLKTMENIQEIRDAAIALHDRTATLVEHLIKVGSSLESAVNNYNKTIGSLEGNFLPQARKIKSLGEAYTKNNIPEMEPVEVAVRQVAGKLSQEGERDEED
ncbi:MAG: DNA recombination protein RmuC [Chitinophagaceae bacterium]|nr:MAG: DNA recombination protein RmuC [Chitinophagaceae bacterium]